ncbi:nuclear protein 1-like, partial [Octodon degus]|uniref:Nuclear protein 1-like n=1 Tax=Octodon degus TaxID=10160 RepID=A0A6P3FJX0_OCTDE
MREAASHPDHLTATSPQPLGPEDEEASMDEYDQYSLEHPCVAGGGRKGRTKREAAANTNRPSP